MSSSSFDTPYLQSSISTLRQDISTFQQTIINSSDIVTILKILTNAKQLINNMDQYIRNQASTITRRIPDMLILTIFSYLQNSEWKCTPAVCKLWQKIWTLPIASEFRTYELRILMLGLNRAGKTTILYKLKLGETLQTIPTVGFNVEEYPYNKKTQFIIWDVGGQQSLRPLWHHYYENTNAIIFVVDSSDRERIDDDSGCSAQIELHRVLEDQELTGRPLLVFANKQDMQDAMTVEEMTKRLNLEKLRDRQWQIQGSSANSGDGLAQGLQWLATTLTKSPNLS